MNRAFRRTISVIVAAVLIFTTVFSMSIAVNAATYTPRLTAPDYSNKYYYSNQNLFYANGYGMPNCTAYAYGRAYELLGSKPNLSRWSAEYWYDDNIEAGAYSYGQTPRLGAIACWYYNGGGGHVAVVEKIENGTITFSNSGWNYLEFYLTTASVNDSRAGGSSNWNFQGYIYILGSDYAPEPDKAPESGVYRTNVAGVLNMRSGAGTSYDKVTTVPNGIDLQITSVKLVDGMYWGKTSYNGKSGWVSLSYCSYVSALPVETTAAPTTVKPTTQPTTVKPTVKPTTQPTTVKPTTQPTTVKPTVKPTTQPTTVKPTVKPTTQPTTVKPTVKTTTQPTTAPAVTQAQGMGVGDVNADGKIDVKDVTDIQKIIALYPGFSSDQKKWADINFDGKVSVKDVSGLQRYLTYRF